MKLKKIGVIAGVFDPIHSGHLEFIDRTNTKYGLDKVFILIEKKSKFKQSFADFPHRKKIVELSIGSKPKVGIYPASSDSFPLSSTLPKIKSEFQEAKIYLLIGNDVTEHINSWPDAGNLLKNVEIVVTDRTGADQHSRVSSGKVRQQIKNGLKIVDMTKPALDYCWQHNLYL